MTPPATTTKPAGENFAELLKESYGSSDGLEGSVVRGRVIAIDDKYMFTVSDSVANKSGAKATLYPYGVVERQGIQKDEASMNLHVGFVGVANGSEVDAKYSDFKDPGTPTKTFSSTGGWVALTDKIGRAHV